MRDVSKEIYLFFYAYGIYFTLFFFHSFQFGARFSRPHNTWKANGNKNTASPVSLHLVASLENLHTIIENLRNETNKLDQSDTEKFSPILNRAKAALEVAEGYEKKLSQENEKLKKENESLAKSTEIAENKEKKAQNTINDANKKIEELERKTDLWRTGIGVAIIYAVLKLIEFILATPERLLKNVEYNLRNHELKSKGIADDVSYEHENCLIKFINRIYTWATWAKGKIKAISLLKKEDKNKPA